MATKKAHAARAKFTKQAKSGKGKVGRRAKESTNYKRKRG